MTTHRADRRITRVEIGKMFHVSYGLAGDIARRLLERDQSAGVKRVKYKSGGSGLCYAFWKRDVAEVVKIFEKMGVCPSAEERRAKWRMNMKPPMR